MARPSPYSEAAKENAITMFQAGTRIPEISKKLAIPSANIYSWTKSLRREDKQADIKPEISGSTKLAQFSLEQQINKVTEEYRSQLKELIIKQVMQNLREMTSC